MGEVVVSEPLAESVAVLSQFFVGSTTVRETLERVAALTVDAVAPAELAGLTLIVEGSERTAVFTDPAAPEIDQAQYDVGDGPCLEAFRSQTMVEIASTATDARWPEFCYSARSHGIGSTLSLPMVVDSQTLGAMNLYARAERAFDQSHRDDGIQFAAHAAVVVANSHAYWEARDLGDRLNNAVRSRAVIEQAKGILMAAQRCGPDEAFRLLVSASQRENLKVRDIAARIVADVTKPRSDGAATTDPERDQ